jgi:hypothetical protein
MKRLAQFVSVAALAGTLVPPCLFFTGALSLDAMQQWMLYAALIWFISTPFWMEHKLD